MKHFITIAILVCTLLFTACNSEVITDEEVTEFTPSSIVFETVAHIPETKFPNYTRVWYDTETDRAVYVINDYVPTPIVSIGDTVVFSNIECEVISTDEQGFEVQLPDNTLAAYGMSGSQVLYNNTPIALVSRATSVTTVYAVYY